MDIPPPILTYDPFASACAPPLTYDAAIAITIVAAVLGIAWTGYHLLMLRRIDLTQEQETEGEEGLIEDMPEEQRKLLLQFGYKVYDAALQFLKLEYLACLTLIVLSFLLLWFLSELGSPAAITFLVGAVVSLAAGVAAIIASTRLSSRITYSSKFGLAPAFRTAYQSASAIAFSTVSLHLLALAVTTHVLKEHLALNNSSTEHHYYRKLFQSLAGYGLGASLVALFTKLGGGIFQTATQAASQISDKAEAALPHLHPRNAATIAKHAGINTGGVVGSNCDLLGSYSQLTCVALLLSSTSLIGWQGEKALCAGVLSTLTMPLLILACGLIASVGVSFAGAVLAWTESEQDMSQTLRMQRIIPSALMAGLLYLCAFLTLPDSYQLQGVTNTYRTLHAPWEAYICAFAGTIASLILALLAEAATHKHLPFLNAFTDKCRAGPAATVTLGLAFGYLALVLPTIVFCLAAFFSYGLLGFYGVSLAALAFLAVTPLQLALQSSGGLAADALAAAGVAGLKDDEKEALAQLEQAGLSASAINRSINMSCSALVGMSLLGGFLRNAGLDTPASETAISLNDPLVFSGLLVGAILPFLLSGLAVKGSRKATALLLQETQRQLREDEGIARGQSEPDYAGSVRPASIKVVLHMIAPVLLVLVVPMVLGLAIGPKIVTGLLLGMIVSGFQFASSTTTSGDAWSSARKFIESGMLTDAQGRVLGEGSQAHRAAVIGTGVGSAFQKCAGGLLNPAIKLMGMLAVLFGSKFAS